MTDTVDDLQEIQPILSVPTSINTHALVGLNKFEEEEMIKVVKRRALKLCAPVVNDFVECASDHAFTPFQCKHLATIMNECVRKQ